MNASVYNISLDLHHSIAPHVLPIKQGDSMRKLCVTLTEDGEPYEIASDCRVILCAVLPGGSTVRQGMTIRNNNTLTMIIPASWTASGGEIECEVQVVRQGVTGRITSPRFSIVVSESFFPNTDDTYVYFYKGSTAGYSEDYRVITFDCNFEIDFPETSQQFGWISIPAALVPLVPGVSQNNPGNIFISATGGVQFNYTQDATVAVGGRQVVFKVYKSVSTFGDGIHVSVREK